MAESISDIEVYNDDDSQGARCIITTTTNIYTIHAPPSINHEKAYLHLYVNEDVYTYDCLRNKKIKHKFVKGRELTYFDKWCTVDDFTVVFVLENNIIFRVILKLYYHKLSTRAMRYTAYNNDFHSSLVQLDKRALKLVG